MARRAKSTCRWEAVEPEGTVELHPLDAIVALAPSNDIVYRIRDCPAPAEDDPIFIGAATVQPRSVRIEAGNVLVWLDEVIPDGAEVYWMGHAREAERVPSPSPVIREVKRGGSPVRVLGQYERRGVLHLVIEGDQPVQVLSDRNTSLRHDKIDPAQGATKLRGENDEVSWTGERRLASERLPEGSVLTADNGVRWQPRLKPQPNQSKRPWIHLLSPSEGDGDELVDPRAAYCEDGVNAVGVVGAKGTIRVFASRRESYLLELEKLPPPGSQLIVAENTQNLEEQLRAVYRLKDAPLPHHRGLLRLCESLEFATRGWPAVEPETVESWGFLTRDDLDGTFEQREFVQKALGTPDFAFLEGPPGSGKTFAICELILQAVRRGERVLLCSTTHVAVDNVLERFVLDEGSDRYPEIAAMRIGRTERVDPRLQACHIDQQIDALLAAWKAAGAFAGTEDGRLESMAEGIVLAASNLTCATTTGVLGHPYIRRAPRASGPTEAHFDLLILDEASKTTFQEFLVPAQVARRWVIVGDVRQLPPFSEPRDLEASFAGIANEAGAAFPPAYQRACLILFRLSRHESGPRIAHWLIEEPADVVTALMAEAKARAERNDPVPELVRVTAAPSTDRDVGVADILAGAATKLRLFGAEVIVGTPEDIAAVRDALPPDLLRLNAHDPAASAAAYRTQRFLRKLGPLRRPVREGRRESKTLDELAGAQRDFFREESWARQIAWRLGRIHQLASAANQRDSEKRRDDIAKLMPASAPYGWVANAIDIICDVGVRSTIEALRVQRQGRSQVVSALSAAIPEKIWNERAVLLTRQHRMNPEISAIPRRLFYNNEALNDANTILQRDAKLGWAYLTDKTPHRRLWVNVRGRERDGRNPEEIDAMRELLQLWARYAEQTPRPDNKPWEVACLSFYVRQERAIRDMLRGITGLARAETRFSLPNSTVVCATVDRFQGREADLVLLSLRNTARTGYMDSPNRLNVAITRARQLLVILGNQAFFSQCHSDELVAIATDTHIVPPGFWR